MTLIMFSQWETAALIVTDTQSSTLENQPALFSSKVRPFPHLNLAITGSGSGAVVSLFGEFINGAVVGASDIEDLNMVAPGELRRIMEMVVESDPLTTPARVQVVGFPAGSEKIVRYDYGSKNDFEPEKFEGNGLWMQPLPHAFQVESIPETREEFIELATRIRGEQDKQIAPNPVGIGGELHATFVQNWSIQTTRWHRFPDYEDARKSMVTRQKIENEKTKEVLDEHR